MIVRSLPSPVKCSLFYSFAFVTHVLHSGVRSQVRFPFFFPFVRPSFRLPSSNGLSLFPSSSLPMASEAARRSDGGRGGGREGKRPFATHEEIQSTLNCSGQNFSTVFVEKGRGSNPQIAGT